VRSKQLSKRDHSKKKPNPDEGHFEGKFWCDCRTRNYRRWLGFKRGMHLDTNMDQQESHTNSQQVKCILLKTEK